LAEEVERLTAELRDNTMSIRMLPIGITFSKFKRLVRDLTGELGKEIELRTTGAETELDKTVIERLSDPLVHLIRNSIDHGIEAPEVREAAGKPRQGTIHLSAAHSGAYVLIQIKDDGAGLDAAAIRAKAVEKNMIAPDAGLTDKELFTLILQPDFSTAKKVSSVSGRGVGMDVVKKAIDALRGSIEIESRNGAGTTITLKLPLTLAIIDGFLTRIGAEHFIFPLSSVEECIELNRETASAFSGRHLVNVRGHVVPFIRLREQFTMIEDAPAIEQVVIVREDSRRVGFVVDTIVGEHQTVLKSLGKFYRDVEGISGATILGDGTVALILDVPKLVRLAELQETRGAHPDDSRLSIAGTS
jgi:two-component system, chemotaxis family, sensor kinase CheA